MRIWTPFAIGMVSLCAASVLMAAPFVPPSDGPVPFRRDRIPLESGAMQFLSTQLVVVAKSLDGSKPELRRCQAQLIALSFALSPGNGAARDALKDFEEGAPKSIPLQGMEKMTERLRQMVAWLDDEAAGKDAAVLGTCLRDVMRYFDPEHPYHNDATVQGDTGEWAGWVPGIEAYKDKVVKLSLPEPEEVAVPKLPEPVPQPPKPGKFALTLPQAEIVTSLWSMVGQKPSQGWSFKSRPIKATASYQAQGDPETFRLLIGEPGGPVDFYGLQNKLEQMLRDYHRELPRGLRVMVQGPELTESLNSQKDQSISAVPATLCSAVITGRKPVAMVIGTVGRDQKLKSGLNFWGKLKSLEKGQGQRLVLSPECEPYLQAKLTMHAVDFFLEYEVMYASTYEQLVDRALEGGSEPVTSASKKFKLIQEVSKGQNILRYVSNIHVKKRLMEVLEQDPNHVSARLLLQQANNGRSNTISQAMVATEMLWILEPVFQVAEIPHYLIGNFENPVPDLGVLEKTTREQLTDLQIYLDRDSRDWALRAGKAASEIRDLEKALNIRDEYQRSQELYSAMDDLNNALGDLRQQLEEAREGGKE